MPVGLPYIFLGLVSSFSLAFKVEIMAEVITGSIIIEQVFGIPGLGRILLTSIQNRDYPVVLAIIMFIAAIVLVSNILVDFLYKIVDPRVAD